MGNGAAEGVHIEDSKYHCGVDLMAPGGKAIKPLCVAGRRQSFQRRGYFGDPTGVAEGAF